MFLLFELICRLDFIWQWLMTSFTKFITTIILIKVQFLIHDCNFVNSLSKLIKRTKSIEIAKWARKMHFRMRCCSYSLCTFPSQVLKYNLYYIYSQLFTCTSLIKLGQYTVELWLNISHTCKYTKNISQRVGIPNTVSLCISTTISHSWISASFSWLHQVLLKTRFIWLIVNQECGSYLININIFLFEEKSMDLLQTNFYSWQPISRLTSDTLVRDDYEFATKPYSC